MGFEPNQHLSWVESVNEFTEQMRNALEEAKAALVKSKDDMARYYNQRWTPALDYKPSDVHRILLYMENHYFYISIPSSSIYSVLMKQLYKCPRTHKHYTSSIRCHSSLRLEPVSLTLLSEDTTVHLPLLPPPPTVPDTSLHTNDHSPTYVSDLRVRPTWLAYISTLRVQLSDHIIILIIYLR